MFCLICILELSLGVVWSCFFLLLFTFLLFIWCCEVLLVPILLGWCYLVGSLQLALSGWFQLFFLSGWFCGVGCVWLVLTDRFCLFVLPVSGRFIIFMLLIYFFPDVLSILFNFGLYLFVYLGFGWLTGCLLWCMLLEVFVFYFIHNLFNKYCLLV